VVPGDVVVVGCSTRVVEVGTLDVGGAAVTDASLPDVVTTAAATPEPKSSPPTKRALIQRNLDTDLIMARIG